MAIAKITLTCSECGCTFTHRKECFNRREADNYESWAVNHIDTCPDCHRKQKADQKAATLAAELEKHGFNLPEVTGASDKQIAYAVRVRERYLADNISRIEGYHKVQQLLNDAEQVANFARVCEEHGMTVEEGIRQNMEAMGLATVQKMLTSTSAREILDSHR